MVKAKPTEKSNSDEIAEVTQFLVKGRQVSERLDKIGKATLEQAKQKEI